jgi:hypothetical protein
MKQTLRNKSQELLELFIALFRILLCLATVNNGCLRMPGITSRAKSFLVGFSLNKGG